MIVRLHRRIRGKRKENISIPGLSEIVKRHFFGYPLRKIIDRIVSYPCDYNKSLRSMSKKRRCYFSDFLSVIKFKALT